MVHGLSEEEGPYLSSETTAQDAKGSRFNNPLQGQRNVLEWKVT